MADSEPGVHGSRVSVLGPSVAGMVTPEELDRWASSFPGVARGETRGNRDWAVAGCKAFAWERPFTKADLRRFAEAGVEPPDGPTAAVRLADLAEKEAVLAATSDAVFTMRHFDGYPAVLVALDAVEQDELRELLLDGWLSEAPDDLAAQYLEQQRDG
jgi:hypothetical protein